MSNGGAGLGARLPQAIYPPIGGQPERRQPTRQQRSGGNAQTYENEELVKGLLQTDSPEYDEYFSLIKEMDDYALEAQGMGYNVNAPDPADPQSIEVAKYYREIKNQAIPVGMRLKSGREFQKQLLPFVMEGLVISDPDARGTYSFNDVLKHHTPNTLFKEVKDFNDHAQSTYTDQSAYDQAIEKREKLIRHLDTNRRELLQVGKMSGKNANAYILNNINAVKPITLDRSAAALKGAKTAKVGLEQEKLKKQIKKGRGDSDDLSLDRLIRTVQTPIVANDTPEEKAFKITEARKVVKLLVNSKVGDGVVSDAIILSGEDIEDLRRRKEAGEIEDNSEEDKRLTLLGNVDSATTIILSVKTGTKFGKPVTEERVIDLSDEDSYGMLRNMFTSQSPSALKALFKKFGDGDGSATEQDETPSATRQQWIDAGWNEDQINQAISSGSIKVTD